MKSPGARSPKAQSLTTSLKKQIGIKIVATFGIRFSGVGLGFILSILLARSMGTAGFGVYGYAMSVLNILSIMAAAGLPLVVLRETTNSIQNVQPENVLVCLQQAHIISFLSWCGIGGVSLLIIAFWRPYDIAALSSLPVYGLIFIGASAFLKILTEVVKGLGFVVISQLANIVKPLATLMLLGVFSWKSKETNLDPASAILFQTGGFAVVLFLFYCFVDSKLPSAKTNKKTRPFPDFGPIIASAFPILIYQVTVFANREADILMLGPMEGATETGIYKAVYQSAMVMQFGIASVIAAISNWLPLLENGKRKEEALRVLKIANWVVFFGTLVFGLALILGGHFLLGLFGESFQKGGAALMVYALGYIVVSIIGIAPSVAQFVGLGKAMAHISLLAGGMNIALNYLFIDRLGMLGAALATIFSLLFLHLFSAILVLRKKGYYPGLNLVLIRG